MRETISRFGALDILVNNAGVILEKPLLETTAADFDWLMSINLRGTFMTGREAIRHMVQAGSGRIINIASDLGYFGREQFSVYCASKAKKKRAGNIPVGQKTIVSSHPCYHPFPSLFSLHSLSTTKQDQSLGTFGTPSDQQSINRASQFVA